MPGFLAHPDALLGCALLVANLFCKRPLSNSEPTLLYYIIIPYPFIFFLLLSYHTIPE
jgi:hypothetical protein